MPFCQNLKVYIETLTGFCYIFSNGLKATLLSKGYILETAVSMRIVGGEYTYIRGGGKEPLIVPVWLMGHFLNMTSSNGATKSQQGIYLRQTLFKKICP